NPPHIGHLIIANEVRHALNLDEVWLMPTAVPPHKAEQGDATAEQRLRMVKLATNPIEGLYASSFEIERGGISYTYDTMEQLTEAEPGTQFYFIIGGDMIDLLPSWHRIDELLKLVTFVGVERPGALSQTNLPVQMIQTPQIDCS